MTGVALIYPPACDPTAPYLSVPMLTGFLRSEGVHVLPIDSNVEAFDALLEPASLARVRDQLEARLAKLESKTQLTHEEQLEYATLWSARGDAHAVVHGIADAKRTLRTEALFFDHAAYGAATVTIDAALRAVSAAHYPLHVDFTSYRTPFGLLNMEEIERMAAPEFDPFDDYVRNTLIPRLRAAAPAVIGISVCFPGQLQPAYAFALKIKRALPHVHLTVGGPGVTQMLIRLQGERLKRALGPFDSAVVFEGEHTLLALYRAVAEGSSLKVIPNLVIRDALHGARYLAGHGMIDLKELPAPDFDGLALSAYLSPRLTIPYDPTRGCYWGKCTFCHYGLAEVGTATYRERGLDNMVRHIRELSEKYGTKHFYFSQDSVAPKTILKLAEVLIREKVEVHWGTDLKPEKYLTKERAETLRRGGAVACALGVESASPRVLELIDKGAPITVVSDVIDHLSDAGVAPEAMCFTDFPTESRDEALATLTFLEERRDRVAVFIVGEFGLTHGSLVAQAPERFEIEEVWEVEGDELGLGLFFEPQRAWKSDADRERVNRTLNRISRDWTLRTYPWAGAVSTAHTLMYYARFGRTVFRDLSAQPAPAILGDQVQEAAAAFDLDDVANAAGDDGSIWWTLVNEERRVSREEYKRRAATLGTLKRRPNVVQFSAEMGPVPVKKTRGRRPSHAHNSTRA